MSILLRPFLVALFAALALSIPHVFKNPAVNRQESTGNDVQDMTQDHKYFSIPTFTEFKAKVQSFQFALSQIMYG
jgi:hypothetical protein